MDSELVYKWNDTVEKDDTVYVLGDFWMGGPDLLKYLKRLNGEKILVEGNHDKKRIKQLKKSGLFSQIIEEPTAIMINGKKVLLSHFPYNEGLILPWDLKFWDATPKGTEDYLFCGHIHNADWKIKDNMYNVGVDVNDYKPVSINDIMKAMVG